MVAAAEQKIAALQHDEIVLVFVRAEIKHQKIVGRYHKAVVAAAHIENVQCAGTVRTGGEKVEPPAVGAELLAFEIAELLVGIAFLAFEQELVAGAIGIDLPQLVGPRIGRADLADVIAVDAAAASLPGIDDN